MLPIILGTVAIGAVGYAINKCYNDEDCIDNVKDKIQDGAMWMYDGLDKVGDKIGLNEYTFSQEDVQNSSSLFSLLGKVNYENNQTKPFEKLYQLKLEIFDKLVNDNIFVVADKTEIKKDKTNEVNITQEMITNLASYSYILQTAYNKLKATIDNNQEEHQAQYINIIKDIFLTKIIKKGVLNDKSSDVILRGSVELMGKS